MKPHINLKIKSIALMLSLLGIFGYHSAAHSGLSIVKGEASGEVRQLGNQTAEGLVIPLRSNFKIQMQNVDDTLVLSVKVVSNATGRVVFTKSAAMYGVIILDN